MEPNMEDKTANAPGEHIVALWKYLSNLLNEFIGLGRGVDKKATVEEITSKQHMSGANAWMLMCSIMIASIGLDINSEAVIIGGMLISPLMSPILGIGLAVGINDRRALYSALRHFGSAMLIAVITSFLYFWISPLDVFTEQIQNRTEPTILDIFIGIFGGIAGIVSIARKDISTTLPGVAIATALMPPLCVTGYGLANGSFDIAAKSFYLFFLNSFFVALATYGIIRYLRFPLKNYANKKEWRKNLIIVGFFSLLMVVPSALIFWDVFNEAKMERTINIFIDEYVGDDRIFLDDHELIRMDDGSRKLILKVYGESIPKTRAGEFEQNLLDLGMKNTDVEIIPTSEISLDKFRALEAEISKVGQKMTDEFSKIEQEKESKEEVIDVLRSKLINFEMDSLNFNRVTSEIRSLYPEIQSVGSANAQFSDFNIYKEEQPIFILTWKDLRSIPSKKEQERIKSFLEERCDMEDIEVYHRAL